MQPIIEVIPAGLSFPVLSTGHSAATWPSPCHDPLLIRGQRPAQEGGPGVAGTGGWASGHLRGRQVM